MTARDPDPRSYREGVELLCAGRPAEALKLLKAVPEGKRSRDRRLALARTYLELERGDDAARCLEPLVQDPPQDSGERALLAILMASARARAGRREDARAGLEGVGVTDSRLERAARARDPRESRTSRVDSR